MAKHSDARALPARPSRRRRQAAPQSGADAGADARVDHGRRPGCASSPSGKDAIFVGGGSTANMLAVWRVHGFDHILREAWEAGVLLFGWSAGMICWFEAGVTDSFRPDLDGRRDGLGFLAGSACPHYDREPLRRPRYRELVDSGFPEGVAVDDGVGLHYVGTELREVLTCRPGAAAYRVTRAGEERLQARLVS